MDGRKHFFISVAQPISRSHPWSQHDDKKAVHFDRGKHKACHAYETELDSAKW